MDEVFEKKNSDLVDYLVRSRFLKTKRIINAFLSAPRHTFVPEQMLPYAYNDMALPTIAGSTISQPSTVAYMLELLNPEPGDNVLEIGAGSGWEACLLSHCVGGKGKVSTIEIDKSVAAFATANVKRAGAKNVEVVCADGSAGYKKNSPYDKIIYAAAAPKIPDIVVAQLGDNGTIIAPIGDYIQTMTTIRKSKGKIMEQKFGTFQFEPLAGKYGF